MNGKSYKSVYLNVLLFILSVVLVITTIYFRAESNEYMSKYKNADQKLKQTQKEYNQLSKDYTELNRINGLSSKEMTAKDVIKNSFNTLYNYNNENFVSRFDKAKKYMTDKVVDKLKGSGGVVEAPKVEIEKRVNQLKIYREIKKDRNIVALVQLESTYSVDGKDNPKMNELYRVRVNLDTNKVDTFELLGSLNIVSES
ncbi:hypothetical protein P5641_00305 (plasmid) [Bacillus subtilis]|uniref:hypothetical protein n=1 Tax=Bacillus subtilis TaxID=1423 RepID=UPI000926627B|nr:hypothetical protein [Bacillus subtilis]OJH63557.1 hypothetical protein BOH71_09950 [Bacillus subtilis]WEY94515.1 hypothetical protein P5641_00305 [Bacillus subtilis]